MPRRELMTIASIQKHRQKASILAADIKAKAETQNKYIFICAASFLLRQPFSPSHYFRIALHLNISSRAEREPPPTN